MSYKKRKEESEPTEIFFPKYSNKELDEFEIFLDGFRHDVEVETPVKEIIRPVDVHKALVAFGAESVKDHIGIPTYSVILENVRNNSYGSIESYDRPTKYELFFDKWEQLKKLRSRQEFFDAKKIEAYEKMAEEIVLPAIPDTI